MARWIRVSVDLEDNLKVAALAHRLDIDLDVAIARCLRLWGRLSLHRPETGLIGDLPDGVLETWAGWRGPRGAFAEAFRALFQDEDGRVHDWEEWNGAALRYERQERERKRENRGRWRADGSAPGGAPMGADAGADGSADAAPDRPRGGRAPVSAPRGSFGSGADGSAPPGAPMGADAAHVRTDGRTDSTPPTNQPSTTTPSTARTVARPWVAEAFWPELDRLLLAVPDPHSWAAELRAHGEGMPGHGPARTPAQLGQAIRDFLASGATQEARPSLKHFRGFIGRTDRGAGPASGGAPQATPRGPTAPRLREITK